MKYNTILTAAAALLSSTCHGLQYSLYSDSNCQILSGSANLNSTTCYPSSGGWSSMRIAGPASDGGVNVFSTKDCSTSGTSAGTSTLFLGCFDIGFVAHSAELS